MSTSRHEPVARHGFWRRTLRMWDLVFVAMVAVYVVAVVVEAERPAEAATALTTVGVLALAYVFVGRPGALQGDPRRADAYLALLVAVMVTQVALGDIGSVLLFLAYSQVWFYSRSRAAGVAWATTMTVAIAAAAVWRERAQGPEIVEVAAEYGVALLFAVVLGLWITQVAEQSEERAYLLDELRAAQDALAESHHAAGVVAERERLAAEIHDTLAQGFTSVVMLTQTAAVELERGHPDRVASRLARIEDVARDNLAEARALVAAFAPPSLQEGTLTDALRRLGARFGAETGVVVDVVDETAGREVPRGTQVVLLRAAQESLANVRRHAGASRVTLRLAPAGDEVVLEVSDDGRGLAPGTPEGNGLRGMRARARAAGGTLDVAGAPGDGTRVRLRVPVTGGTDAATGTRDEDAGSPGVDEEES